MNSSTSSDVTVRVTIPEVKAFIVRCLTACGSLESHALQMADLLVAADNRGHFSHGLNRLEYYVRDFHLGLCAVDKEPEILNETVATALVDGNNAMGPVVGNFCMKLAIKKAKEVGIGWVVARASNHFGIAGFYSLQALEHGLLGMAFTNSSPLSVATRSKEMAWKLVVPPGTLYCSMAAVLGTNPLSLAAPANGGDSFVLDMATTSVALGKVEVQARKDEPIPAGWALGCDGKVTTDPKEALKSWLLLPLGGEEHTSGYKGYGLAMMVEIFCGVLSAASVGPQIRKWNEPDGLAELGQCFVAINPNMFAPGFEGRLSGLIDHCRNMEPVDPAKPILIPGDPERIHMSKVEAEGGINYHVNVIKVYDELATTLNVAKIKRV